MLHTLDEVWEFQRVPLDPARIAEAVQAVREEGERAWDWIEPLAGLLFPRVEAEIKRQLSSKQAEEADRG